MEQSNRRLNEEKQRHVDEVYNVRMGIHQKAGQVRDRDEKIDRL